MSLAFSRYGISDLVPKSHPKWEEFKDEWLAIFDRLPLWALEQARVIMHGEPHSPSVSSHDYIKLYLIHEISKRKAANSTGKE